MKDRSRDDAMAELFRDDPEYAVGLLNNILEDGDQQELAVTARQVVKALERRNIADALTMPGIADIDFEPPRAIIGPRPTDFT